RLVGDADGQPLDHAGLLARVRAWRTAFAAAAGNDWALHFDDSVAFAAALLGAWSAGKRVYLAADRLPATLQALQPHVDGFAGDLEPHWAPLAMPLPEAAAGIHDEFSDLDELSCRLVVFTSGSTGEPEAIEKRLDQLAREV